MARTAGHGHAPGYQRGCEACQRASREDKRALRARHRGIDPEPELEPEPEPLTVVELVEPDHGAEDGPVVAAVKEQLAMLSAAQQELVGAVAVALGKILDDRRLSTTHPSAGKQLVAIMEKLRQASAPKRGRLAVVQEMAPSVKA